MHLSQALPGLFIGSCPENADDIGQLKTDYGITAILNLQTDHDLDYWDLAWNRIDSRCKELDVVVRRIPVKGYDASDLREKLPECVEAADALLRAGHTVYAHCNVGAGRSSSVAVALLRWKQGMSLEEAVEQVIGGQSCDPDVEGLDVQRGAGVAA